MSHRVPLANPRSGAEIDLIALNIIKQFQPEVLTEPSLFDIEKFFEFDVEVLTGVQTDYRGDLPPGIYGYTDSDEMVSIISSHLMDDPFQIRFCRSTIAHESGHAFIHVHEFRRKKALLRSMQDKKDVSLRLHREANVPVFRNPEWQAFRFAGGLLMPEQTFRFAVMEGHGERDLAEMFGVNLAFIRSRAKALKLII